MGKSARKRKKGHPGRSAVAWRSGVSAAGSCRPQPWDDAVGAGLVGVSEAVKGSV